MKKLNVFIGGSTYLDFSLDKNYSYNNQLLEAFHQHGFKFCDIKTSDWLICINHSRKDLYSFLKQRKSSANTILIRTEPYAVFPAQYKARIEDKYGLIITYGRKENTTGKFYEVEHPYTYLPNPNLQMMRGKNLQEIFGSPDFRELFTIENWKTRPIYLSLIASNKVSATSNSNYQIRRDLAQNSKFNQLEIYGKFWNGSSAEKLMHRLSVLKFSVRAGFIPNITSVYGNFFQNYENYIGQVPDKHLIVRQSKFSLVVENSSDYVSEKLFDALMNGSIPLYYGPNLENMGVPGNQIALEFNGTSEGLEKQISGITEKEVSMHLKSSKEYLESASFLSKWTEQNVYRKIIKKIQKFCS